jgi:hypothetical protein
VKPAIHCLFDELWPPEKFVEHPRNPNRHPQSQVALLARIIETNGWRNPMVVSKQTGLLIRGHGRLAAARWAGLESCPVSIQSYETPDDELADMLADNRIAELSTLDTEAILKLVEQLQASGDENFATGFTEVDIQNMILAMPDDGNFRPGEFTEEGSENRTTGNIPIMTLNGRKYPLGEDENSELLRLTSEYIAEKGNLLGFVAHLLTLSK